MQSDWPTHFSEPTLERNAEGSTSSHDFFQSLSTKDHRSRPTTVVVDRGAIRHNIRALSPPGTAVLAMVKGNGYGHGAEEVALSALAAGATWLGVSMVEEGLTLRRAGITAPVLVTTEYPAGSEIIALKAGLTPAVYSVDGARRLVQAASTLNVEPAAHVKVDTGLNRVGANPSHVVEIVEQLTRNGIRIGAIWTHLAVSDELDNSFTLEQLDRLRAVLVEVTSRGHSMPLIHVANTAAIMAWPETHFGMVRAGIGIFGVSPSDRLPGASGLRPTLTWRSAVTYVKRVPAGHGVSYGLTFRPSEDTTIATVPVGFADGYPRNLSNRGSVLINGRRHRIAGTIAMDQLMVDCGNHDVHPGDEVMLLGPQGCEDVTVAELASLAGTIPDEIFCGINIRIPRSYIN